ncbi:MAG: DUF3990 domain-containing protein [Eggerthellaceae bacterium]|nr:DUF3990 domain-containing protein [Eggerthellaceae bacterium]
MYAAREFFGKDVLTLYHGSSVIVRRPSLEGGRPNNDYGRGFYCTESLKLASEWACPTLEDGFANEYKLPLDGLTLLDLSSAEFNVLNWLAVLLENRTFENGPTGWSEGRQFIIDRYRVDIEGFDIIHGYRADDSYFSFARDFLTNQISVKTLEQALFLGGLGYQVVLKTQRAFAVLEHMGADIAQGSYWNPLRMACDGQAREKYQEVREKSGVCADDIFLIDLMRGGR